MTTLKITGMTCDSCAAHVKEALEKVPGVQSALVSYPKGTAQLAIEAGTSSDALTTCLLYTSPSPRDKKQIRMPSSA